MGDKFDFNVANNLISALTATASALEIKNEEMEKQFKMLREGFKDSGYDEYAIDVASASNALQEVTMQLKSIAKSVADYTNRLKGI